MKEYFLLMLLSIVVGVVCCSCCVGCNVCRRRLIEEERTAAYNEFENNANAPANRTSPGVPPCPVGGTYHEIYYHTTHNPDSAQHGDGGVGLGPYFAGVGHARHSTGARHQQQQPLPATVLIAAPPDSQGEPLNFTQYFPEARLLDSGGAEDAALNPGRGSIPGNAATGEAVGRDTQEPESPYGESVYLHQKPATAVQAAETRSAPHEMPEVRTPTSPGQRLPPAQYPVTAVPAVASTTGPSTSEPRCVSGKAK